MRLLLTALSVIIIDQLSKYIVQTSMLHGQSIPLIKEFFHLTYIQNPGAAFGILPNQTWFFVIITILVITVILLTLKYFTFTQKLTGISMGMIAGGAAGNLIDRIRIGKVIDFFDLRVWPVFNVADTAIVVGASLLIWIIWKSGEDDDKVNNNAK
ncbi:MAG: signal peptidase II [Clostridiales bacterium]|nr:signal peptidase II [Clostridiales bacterium]MCF8022770.1 signal peptidase II [Clostridiales bacterium]